MAQQFGDGDSLSLPITHLHLLPPGLGTGCQMEAVLGPQQLSPNRVPVPLGEGEPTAKLG